MTKHQTPSHLSREATEWFESCARNYELGPHHVKLLTLACEAWDRAVQARQRIEADGAFFENRFGEPRVHPAVAVERDCRIGFARLVRELGLSDEEIESRPPVFTGSVCATLMPVRRRLRKRGTGDWLSAIQRLHLRRGDAFGLGSVFPDAAAERDAWTAHRDAVLGEQRVQSPGTRPAAWWTYDAPWSRDEETHETIQLLAMGEIGTEELHALKVRWRHWEGVARSREGEREAWRCWAGIPTWFHEGEAEGEPTKDGN